MTENKRFNYHHDGFGAYYLCDKEKGVYEDGIMGEIWADKSDMIDLVKLLNTLHEENELLQKTLDDCNELNALAEENKQLKQDNTGLMHLLENQSIIVQELHSKLLEHQLKEPIILTKEDLELMGKAVSYYTHGRCVE